MPKKEIDYSKTDMYRIVSKDPNNNELVYVGHTTNFVKRKNCHKTKCNNEDDKRYNMKVYKTIRENGGWDEFEMIQIEVFNCSNKREAETRERYWLEFYNAKLNSCIPTRTQKEYREANVDKIKEYNENYYEANVDKIKEQKKEYRVENVDKIKEYAKKYYQTNKEQTKEYLEANKDKIKEQKRQYYQANKEKKAEKYRETHKK